MDEKNNNLISNKISPIKKEHKNSHEIHTNNIKKEQPIGKIFYVRKDLRSDYQIRIKELH
jgi:hypothetical protein